MKKINELKRGDLIIVADLSLLSRSIINFSKTIKLIREKGIDLFAIKEQMRFSVENPQLISTSDALAYFGDLMDIYSRKSLLENYDKSKFDHNYVKKSEGGNKHYSVYTNYREDIIKLLEDEPTFMEVWKNLRLAVIVACLVIYKGKIY